jgi:hypothetical protein
MGVRLQTLSKFSESKSVVQMYDTLSKHSSNKRLPDCKNKKGGCGLISRVRLLYSESCSGD